MTIKLRRGARVARVDVRDRHCPTLACFWATRHTIRSSVGASGVGSRTTEEWECGRREQRGCPAHPIVPDPAYYRRRGEIWEETS